MADFVVEKYDGWRFLTYPSIWCSGMSKIASPCYFISHPGQVDAIDIVGACTTVVYGYAYAYGQ